MNLISQAKKLVGDVYNVVHIRPKMYSLVDDIFFVYTFSDEVSKNSIKDYYSSTYEFKSKAYILDYQTVMTFVPFEMDSDEAKIRMEIIEEILKEIE